jgi:hypothetical protein
MFRDPNLADFYNPNPNGIPDGGLFSATEVAQREAWAYKMLAQYQGSSIPFSYGFYIVMFTSFIPDSLQCILSAPDGNGH